MVVAALLDAHFKHITEREGDGTWEDCTWCAGLEWYRICFDRTRPASHAEAEALRAASGEPPTGGSNQGDFARGVKARYGENLPVPVNGIANLHAALQPGFAASVQGSMSAFGSAHRLSVYDRNFNGAHCVLVVNINGTLYWCDPEAPATANVPVVISWSELAAFVNAFAGQHLVAPIFKPAPKEDPMLAIVTPLLGYTATIKPGSNIRVEPHIPAALVRRTGTTTTTVQRVVGYVVGDVDPGNQKNLWLGWLEGTEWRFTAIDNVMRTVAPVVTTDDGFTKATQDAAVAAAVAPLNSQIAVLQPLADIGSAAVAFIKRAVG